MSTLQYKDSNGVIRSTSPENRRRSERRTTMQHYSDTLLSVQLEKFALAVLEESRDLLADLDGDWVQDKAEELGLLVRVTVTIPCGELCRCSEYDDFPQECLRYSEPLRAKLKEQK